VQFLILKKRLKAFGFAFSGIAYFFKEGVHAKIMFIVALLVILLALLLKVNYYEWLTLLLCIGLVLALEAFNSALEYLVDLVSPQYHILAKKCKDVAAAAVLIFSFFTSIIGLIIFVPKIVNHFHGL
jgi:diacylglycerol kinase